jgi:hypothetical protein
MVIERSYLEFLLRRKLEVLSFSGVHLSPGLADEHGDISRQNRSRAGAEFKYNMHWLLLTKVLINTPVFHLLMNHLLIFCEGSPGQKRSAKICLKCVSGGGESQTPAICNK